MSEVVELRTSELAAAFDRHADTYDDIAMSAVGRVFRERVRTHLRGLVAPGSRVLDLGCGTGIDALWFAKQDCRVVAVDTSSAMVDQALTRVAAEEAHARVNVEVADVASADLAGLASRLPQNEPGHESDGECFDVVLANFGVINCVPDLAEFGERLSAAVASDASVVLVSMSPLSLTERAEALVGRNRNLWNRRQRIDLRGDTDADGYQGLNVSYLSAARIGEAMGRDFNTVSAEAIGVALPTFEQRRIVEARPRLLSALCWADAKLGPLAARTPIGDHHIVTLTPVSGDVAKSATR